MSSIQYCLKATAATQLRDIHLQIYAAVAALRAHFVVGARMIVNGYTKIGVDSLAGSSMLNEAANHSLNAYDGEALFCLGGSANDSKRIGIARSLVSALTTFLRKRAAKTKVTVKIDPTMRSADFLGTGIMDTAEYDEHVRARNAWLSVRYHNWCDTVVDGAVEPDSEFLFLGGLNNAKDPVSAGTLCNDGNGAHRS